MTVRIQQLIQLIRINIILGNLNGAPRNYWTKKRGIKATKWLIEEKLQLKDNEVIDVVSTKLFKENGLGGCLKTCFNDSPINAVVESYPEKYKRDNNTIKNSIKDQI